jgi:hypothetical protein
VVKYQPLCWFTAAPQFLSHQTPAFWLLEYLFLLKCFVTGNEMAIIDELAAPDANQI